MPKALKWISLALLAVVVSSGPAYASAMFHFQYNLPAPEPGFLSVSGSGTLFTNDPVNNVYLITGIQGTRTVDGTDEAITGLTPPGMFAGNSNLLYFMGMLFLDGDGMSFTVANSGGNDGYGNVNLFRNPNQGYTEIGDGIGYGTFVAFQAADPVPEPSSLLLVFLGIGGVALGSVRARLRK